MVLYARPAFGSGFKQSIAYYCEFVSAYFCFSLLFLRHFDKFTTQNFRHFHLYNFNCLRSSIWRQVM